MQINLDPTQETPSTLRALAHFFYCLASDRDGGKVPTDVTVTVTKQVGDVSITESRTAPADSGNAPAAVSASDDSTSPAADASGDNTTYSADDLDAAGLPWDKRIHSSSKNRNADNTWRYLRGGDLAERAKVEAELRQALTTASASDAPPPPPPPVVDTATNDAPPPPPPIDTSNAAPTGQATMQEVFKRASQLPKEQRDQALGVVELSTMADFLREVKTRPTLADDLLNAIVAITGEE